MPVQAEEIRIVTIQIGLVYKSQADQVGQVHHGPAQCRDAGVQKVVQVHIVVRIHDPRIL